MSQENINEEIISDDELEALLTEAEATPEADPTVDIQKRLEEEQRKTAILQRLLNKEKKAKEEKSKVEEKPITKNNLENEIAEIKFSLKVANFAEENGLSKKQAEQVLKLNPNATAETLQDPFFKAGLEALQKKNRVEENMPKGGSGRSTKPEKKYSDMTEDERKDWYASRLKK
jgi:hypothetical protein